MYDRVSFSLGITGQSLRVKIEHSRSRHPRFRVLSFRV